MESQSLSSPAGLRDLPVQLHRSRADSQRNQTNGLRPFRSLAEELGTRPKLPGSRTVVVTRSNDRWISLKSRLTILMHVCEGYGHVQPGGACTPLEQVGRHRHENVLQNFIWNGRKGVGMSFRCSEHSYNVCFVVKTVCKTRSFGCFLLDFQPFLSFQVIIIIIIIIMSNLSLAWKLKGIYLEESIMTAVQERSQKWF